VVNPVTTPGRSCPSDSISSRGRAPRPEDAWRRVIGAGGSGVLLLHTNDRRRLQATVVDGLNRKDIPFDFDGSVVLLGNG
jgi:hypothetical protein